MSCFVYKFCSPATDAAASSRGRAVRGPRVPHGPDFHLLVFRATAAAATTAATASADASADPDGHDAAAAVRGPFTNTWCDFYHISDSSYVGCA